MPSQSRLGVVAYSILLWFPVLAPLGCALDKTPESRGLRAAALQPNGERRGASLPEPPPETDTKPSPEPNANAEPIYLPDAVMEDATEGPEMDAGTPCDPKCQERECGSDGCPGDCGRCDVQQQQCDEACQATLVPPQCVPACEGRTCGDDGCGGSCGTCLTDAVCSADGDCSAEPPRTDSERCQELVATDASATCKQCACEKCTQLTNACYLSGDGERDARCAMLAECSNRNGCYDEDCYCGNGFLCLDPDGLCKAETELAVGSTDRQAIRSCYDDPDCASYRAHALGECLARDCAGECDPNPRGTPSRDNRR